MTHVQRLRRAPLIFALAVLLVLSLLPAAAGAAPSSTGSGERVPDQLLVRFHAHAPGAAVANARRAALAQELAPIEALDINVWRVPEGAGERVLAALKRNPNVEFAEADAVVKAEGQLVPNDPLFSQQWGLTNVQAPTAWATTTGAESTRIAIVDTGVTEVGDLAGKVLRGHNVLDGSTNAMDNFGHGTRSASVAGAATDNGGGIAAYCWDCMILPVKVMEAGSGYMSDLAKGITWAADNGAHVISMSLSGTTGTNAVQSAVRYAHDRGAVLVAAAGNQGDTTPRYPAGYEEVISVAATDDKDRLYSWSNHGQWVDVSAPGVNHSVGNDGSIATYAGTSSATPAVAGVLGLGISVGADAAELRDAVRSTAKPLSSVRYGRIDAAAMLDQLAPTSNDPDPEPTSPDPGTPPEPEPSPEPELSAVKLSGWSSAAGGPNWTANVTIEVLEHGVPASGVTVSGTWSAGASGTSSCTTREDGTCTVSKPNIHNRDKSVVYTVTAAWGTAQEGPSVTVSR